MATSQLEYSADNRPRKSRTALGWAIANKQLTREERSGTSRQSNILGQPLVFATSVLHKANSRGSRLEERPQEYNDTSFDSDHDLKNDPIHSSSEVTLEGNDFADEQTIIVHDLFSKLLTRNLRQPARISDHSSTSAVLQPGKATNKRLDHNRYTVGWICALPVEMSAARAMLDEEHLPLPNPTGDHNAYLLGAIGGHNIVMTCVRSGVYGLTSATAAAIAMASTYPNSTTCPLLVGIGGGVPSYPHCDRDVRLGDVVIGTPSSRCPAIQQYDLGKMEDKGVLKTTGTLNKSAPAVLNALSLFQSELALQKSPILQFINEAHMVLLNDFSRPHPQSDILHGPECEHSQDEPCSVNLVNRPPRKSFDPEIHFGSIGSGNQVIKHARTRDRIATKASGIFCFETEAAGVMDYMPCLVIRGICDYCDAHKNKEWQGYAALTAAAVAKAVLLVAPVIKVADMSTISFGTNTIETQQRDDATSLDDPSIVSKSVANINHIDQDTIIDRRRKLLRLLNYDDHGMRRATIRQAHSDTCKWLFKQQQLCEWMDPTRYADHQGILWMKGKPGTGKSTVMKYITEQAEDYFHDNENMVIVSFFFNARGLELGRSTVGMYRALLTQIFESLPVLQSLLDSPRLNPILSSSSRWTVEILEEILQHVVKGIGPRHLVLFIDALDECPESQVREMVRCLAKLAGLAYEEHLHICFASRHYPHISLNKGYEFILEEQQGHAKDILQYLDAEFTLENEELTVDLRQRMFTKSGQIFLWIVLVVQVLKREYDHGGVHRLSALLDDVPTEVSQLFRDMLRRDSHNLPQLVLAIQWVLYASRPLRLEELYHAMLYAKPDSRFEESHYSATVGDMKRYLLSCSKGILEQTVSKDPRIQFIHETVREYLLQPEGLKDLWSGFEGINEGDTHEYLKKSCLHYLAQVEKMAPSSELEKMNKHAIMKLGRKFPFLYYAGDNLLLHAEKAQSLGISQTQVFKAFDYEYWNKWRRPPNPPDIEDNAIRALELLPRNKHGNGNARPNAAYLGIVLAVTGREKLFASWVATFELDDNWYTMLPDFLMSLALAELWQEDLDHGQRERLFEKCSMFIRKDYERRQVSKTRQFSADDVCYLLRKRLLDPKEEYSCPSILELRNMIDEICTLIQADPEYLTRKYNQELVDAACHGDYHRLQHALRHNADVNTQDNWHGRLALRWAIGSLKDSKDESETRQCISTLLDHGADAFLIDSEGKNAVDMIRELHDEWLNQCWRDHRVRNKMPLWSRK